MTAGGDGTLPVTNPRTGEIDYRVKAWSADEIAGAASSLREEARAWEALGVDGRCAALEAWGEALAARRGELGEALTIDTGRRTFAHFEVQKAIDLISHWCRRAPALAAEARGGQSAQVPSVHYRHRLVPYPVVGIISPWNVPLILALIDAVPALAAGCTVLLKPSEVTPRFTVPLVEALTEVPALARVLRIVTGGAETGAAVIDQADAVCFTGSVATGRLVAAHAARRFIPAFLELGGKDPAIVTATADLDNAARAIVRSAIGMTGQACQSLERVYVQAAVYPAFREKVVAEAERVQLNWPDIDSGQIGPLIFPPQAEKIQAQLDDAVARGARILCGGRIERHGGGRWCLPTVLENVSDEMQLMREETFGPLIPLIPFDSSDEAVRRANDSDFGLSAAVFAGTEDEAIAIAEQLEVGAVSVNDASLTGIVNDVEKNSFRLSGLGGSRMGDSGFRRFLRKRALLIQTAEAAPITLFSEGQVPGQGPDSGH
jgi:acyl-CoA reductase-like NAD-dependent aldehyde dehydrogenase